MGNGNIGAISNDAEPVNILADNSVDYLPLDIDDDGIDELVDSVSGVLSDYYRIHKVAGENKIKHIFKANHKINEISHSGSAPKFSHYRPVSDDFKLLMNPDLLKARVKNALYRHKQ